MIKKIKFTNSRNESITLDLVNPEKSGFAILDIEGLGPVKSNLIFSDIIGVQGAKFNSGRLDKRNIVIKLRYITRTRATLEEVGYDFASTAKIEDIRQRSYKYFSVMQKIRVTIETDNRTVYTDAYVESNEPVFFSKISETVISLLCENPFFISEELETISFSAITPSFQFPFSNNSPWSNLLIMSSLDTTTLKIINYDGDASVGFVMHIHAIGEVTGVSVTKMSTSETLSINSNMLIAITGSDIIAGDDIYISTAKGYKYAILIRDGVEYNILSALGLNPPWFVLDTGDNIFYYDSDVGITNLLFYISYQKAFEGL
jgi:hypothetical protein